MNSFRPTWAEIDLGAIAHNIRELRRLIDPSTKFMAVLKANAYGHGILEVAEVCVGEKVDYLGVALLDEAMYLLENGINLPVLILGFTEESDLGLVIKNGFRQTVFDLATAQALSNLAMKEGKKAFVHIKVDTGMSRTGFMAGQDAVKTVSSICRLPGLIVEGVFTHLATADDADRNFTELQLQRFNDFLGALEEMGIRIPLRHAANSAGVTFHPEAHYDLVRAGINIYGLRSSLEYPDKLNLIPAMCLKSRVVMVKEVPASSPVSYGCSYITSRPTRIATIPIGYGDGYTRAYSNRAWATINGRRMQLIGRVCMDYCMFDITGAENIKVGDEVILFGRPEDGITADHLAELIGTINYEVVCLLNSRVHRVYVNDLESE
ncbi:MAG: alanine racemase [Syntrophomonadaceae bacterium]|nr:alanine racemase [Syntrophomonadaceae bacterium]